MPVAPKLLPVPLPAVSPAPMEVLSSSPPAVSSTSGPLNTNLIENETDTTKNLGPEIQSGGAIWPRAWGLESSVTEPWAKPRGGQSSPRGWRIQTCEHAHKEPHFPAAGSSLPAARGTFQRARVGGASQERLTQRSGGIWRAKSGSYHSGLPGR